MFTIVKELTKQTTPWIRHGECNSCGDCCRQGTNIVEVSLPMEEEYGRVRFGAPTGWLGATPVFTVRGPIQSVCPELKDDKCGIHDRKPAYCADAPLSPEDVDNTRCSFWFEHQETHELRYPKVLRERMEGHHDVSGSGA